MRRSIHLALCLLALAALAVPTAGCGDDPSEAWVAPDEPVVWMEAKPSPIGSLAAAVIERPARDRVYLDARWARGQVPGACSIEVVVPPGVLVIDDEQHYDLGTEAVGGGKIWLLEVPQDGRTFDAVVRFCLHTVEGTRAMECAVRLTH